MQTKINFPRDFKWLYLTKPNFSLKSLISFKIHSSIFQIFGLLAGDSVICVISHRILSRYFFVFSWYIVYMIFYHNDMLVVGIPPKEKLMNEF